MYRERNKELLEKTSNEQENTELSEAEIRVLSLIKNNNKLKIVDFVRMTNYSESYINKIIRLLKDKEYIERLSANKNGSWRILK